MEKDFDQTYDPQEDSKLLLKHALAEVKLQTIERPIEICEVGVGSGFVITSIAKEFPYNHYSGCDINSRAVEETENSFYDMNMDAKIIESNLFENFEDQTFDIILFNAPYFPFEEKEDTFETLSMKDRALYGGKKGWEVLEEFILNIYNYMNKSAHAIIIFSSLTNLDQIKQILNENYFQYSILEEENSFFEKIYCLKFWKDDLLEKLQEKKIIDVRYLAHGKHSNVLDGKFKGKEVVIKIGKPQHIEKEVMFLEKLQNEDFVPKIHFGEKEYVIREKYEAPTIIDFLEKSDKKSILIVLDKILKITQRLDELGINKFEMVNPYKHIYVFEDLEVKMIDYERCIFTAKPKNTTQVLEFFRRYRELLSKKGIKLDEDKIMEISKKYKEEHFNFHVKDIISE